MHCPRFLEGMSSAVVSTASIAVRSHWFYRRLAGTIIPYGIANALSGIWLEMIRLGIDEMEKLRISKDM